MNRGVDQQLAPGDDLDVVLGDFFKAEMPTPWPAFRKPTLRLVPPPKKERRPWQSFRARLALAASVGILALSAWMLPHSLTSPSRTSDSAPVLNTEGGGATRKPDLLPPLHGPKIKSKSNLEQGKGGTGIKMTIEEDPSRK